jgi:glutamine synthetase
MVTINSILAEALDHLASELEALLAKSVEFNEAVQIVLESVITNHGSIVFNGDAYTEEWQTEAAARGLPNLRTTLDALPELVTDAAIELFSRYGVFSAREMHSRYEVALEHYALSIGVEARITLEIANTIILPASLRYQTELATNVARLRAISADADTTLLQELSDAISTLRAGISTLRSELSCDQDRNTVEEAEHAGRTLLPAMANVRQGADNLEGLVADDLWPLATYQEMLFIL